LKLLKLWRKILKINNMQVKKQVGEAMMNPPKKKTSKEVLRVMIDKAKEKNLAETLKKTKNK